MAGHGMNKKYVRSSILGVVLVASQMTYYEAKVPSFGCTSSATEKDADHAALLIARARYF